MSPRTRKFIGAVCIVVYLPIYIVVAMALAEANPIRDATPYVRMLLYTFMGLAWILPLMPLISWMSKPAKAAPRG